MTDQTAKASPSTSFIDVDVTIIPPESGTKYTVVYSSTSAMDPIPVTTPDTVFRFRLINTPTSIVFVGMVSKRAEGDKQHQIPQMSTYSISLDRRSLICSDAYTDTGDINITLQWIDGVPISDDPQVGNIVVPPPAGGNR